jgi:hypothetical protein
MTEINQHGLARSIPAAVKREVRKKCGFGCVICGSGLYEYEHVDPEFKDAKEHIADGITLLCPGCHGRVTKTQWSKSKVKKHMAAPEALSNGYAGDVFDLCGGNPFITVGGMTLRNCRVPLRIFGKDILKFEPPTDEGGPFLLSGTLCDELGRPTLVIDKNEWKASSDSWDVTTIGAAIEVRNGPGDIVLRLVANPPNGITIERLKMTFGPVDIFASEDVLTIDGPLGGGSFSGCLADHCSVGMDLFSFQDRNALIDPRLTWSAKIARSKVIHGDSWLGHYMQSLL